MTLNKIVKNKNERKYLFSTPDAPNINTTISRTFHVVWKQKEKISASFTITQIVYERLKAYIHKDHSLKRSYNVCLAW